MQIKLLAALTSMALMLALGTATAQRSAGETVDDTTVASATKLALIDNSAVPAGSINVESYKGVVQLIGWVHDDAEIKAAIETAEAVDGVVKVENAMIVAQSRRTFGKTIDDQAIKTKLKFGMTEENGIDKALDVVTDVRNGEVILGGFVSSDRVRDNAEKIAKEIKGVDKVYNKISIKK
jgi:hyperosmotically inducible protein